MTATLPSPAFVGRTEELGRLLPGRPGPRWADRSTRDLLAFLHRNLRQPADEAAPAAGLALLGQRPG